jgi:hypothetical protein
MTISELSFLSHYGSNEPHPWCRQQRSKKISIIHQSCRSGELFSFGQSSPGTGKPSLRQCATVFCAMPTSVPQSSSNVARSVTGRTSNTYVPIPVGILSTTSLPIRCPCQYSVFHSSICSVLEDASRSHWGHEQMLCH